MRHLKQAGSRREMRSFNVWLPNGTHRALARVRVVEGIAISEAIRLALAHWLARRAQKGGRA